MTSGGRISAAAYNDDRQEGVPLTVLATSHAGNTMSWWRSGKSSAIPVGPTPRDVLLDAGRSAAFIAESGRGSVARIDLRTGQLLARYACGGDPRGLALLDKQRLLCVGCREPSSLHVLHADSGELIYQLSLPPSPRALCVDARHSRLFVSCMESDLVAVVELNQRRLARCVGVPARPYGLAFDAQRELLLGTSIGFDELFSVGCSSWTIVSRVKVNRHPTAVCVDARGHAYVAAHDDDCVDVVVPNGGHGSRRLIVGRRPFGLAIHEAQQLLAVACVEEGSVDLLSLPSGELIRRYRTGPEPHAVALF